MKKRGDESRRGLLQDAERDAFPSSCGVSVQPRRVSKRERSLLAVQSLLAYCDGEVLADGSPMEPSPRSAPPPARVKGPAVHLRRAKQTNDASVVAVVAAGALTDPASALRLNS